MEVSSPKSCQNAFSISKKEVTQSFSSFLHFGLTIVAALDVEGIFRLSGSAVLIQEYKQKFDAGEDVSFENENDPHAVAGLFKLYFRELPAPVMTWEHYDDFIIAECTFLSAWI